ncbi:MAG: PEP/pyruvate-binding domain-containing protein, partial [Bacteroidota bacterium]
MKNLLLSFLVLFFSIYTLGQEVDIDNYSVSLSGQVQLSIEGNSDKYYLLHAQHAPGYNWVVSMSMGADGTMIITEPAAAYPLENYTITEHDIASPGDWDGDGIDDVTEYNNMPTDAPLNYAPAIDFIDGATSIPDAETFLELATVNNVGWAPFLDDQLYVKFGILNRDTPQPQVYFINSNTYTIHGAFWSGIGASVSGDDGSGEIVYNPNVIGPGGVVGSYSFNFSFGNAYDFEATQRTYELLAANMPFLQGNMNHFIGQSDENDHLNNYADQFEDSRFDVVLESDVFAEINYIPFHLAEGYGFFRHMTDLEETPGSRDIVLYDALPNSLPRVGGIMTSVIQTPLSHVNLRAIQDNVPNAYIEDPLSIDSIVNLLGNYIYYKVENETYQIREATLEEVNAWYEDLRPTEPQFPVRDLSITEITPLDEIEFDMSTAFGAKCSNVATMRSFDLPEGTIPNGFGIPFYYYDEFMQYNDFYAEAQAMIENEVFQNDINFRVERLKDFRQSIRQAPMPQWMLDDLQAMHDAFPEGTNVRCRSSTNNEDLPGFSGAGLYTSKTQYPEEGHIQKSIKQVYASMWNFRAYEERDFSRVDHFLAAMGVLCHPNFVDEKSNGVGISIDPIYETEGTFYLNTQVGESLITNPDPNSVPEEILLYEDPEQAGGYLVLRLSNLVEPGELVMDQIYLDQMRDYLGVIHDEFAELYGVAGVDGFAMDIEYKVTAQDQLAIKQARPWVSFWADIKGDNDLSVEAILDPQSSSTLGTDELVSVNIANTGLNPMSNFDLELVVNDVSQQILNITEAIEPFEDQDYQFTVPQDFSTIGEYHVTCIVSNEVDEYGNNDTLTAVITKIFNLDGEVSIGAIDAACDDEVLVEAIVTNHGQLEITSAQIEVIVNGDVVNVVNAPLSAPFEGQDSGIITIDGNLNPTDNDITLNLLTINGQIDEDSSNNSASTTTDLDSSGDIITLVINADNYPQETSWELFDVNVNQLVASGEMNFGDELFTEDICVNYNSCFSLIVYDSFGDGICCQYGIGDFLILNAEGETIVYNDGDFDYEAQEDFCPSDGGCSVSAEIAITSASSASANDGGISINTSSGFAPFQYSIDGGQTYSSTNFFGNLSAGSYDIVVQSSLAQCFYEETIELLACTFNEAEIVTENVPNASSSTGSIEINLFSGTPPYQYSIDGGQSYVTTNVFTGLPIGTYNVIIKDASDICPIEIGVPIVVDATLNTENPDTEILNGISLFPNPTENAFNIELSSFSDRTIYIEVYDQLGRKVHS